LGSASQLERLDLQ